MIEMEGQMERELERETEKELKIKDERKQGD